MPIFLDEFLTDNGMERPLKNRVLGWFSRINGHANKMRLRQSATRTSRLSATDEASLSDVLKSRSNTSCSVAFRRDEPTRQALETAWEHINQAPEPPPSSVMLRRVRKPQRARDRPSQRFTVVQYAHTNT